MSSIVGVVAGSTALHEPPSRRTAGRFVRLTACPQCYSRRREIVEVDGALIGRCFTCGDELALPLTTERYRNAALGGVAAWPFWAPPDDGGRSLSSARPGRSFP